MIRKYAFNVQIIVNKGNPFLQIKPVVLTKRNKIISMDPIYFDVLNVPIRDNTPDFYTEIRWPVSHFLDFGMSFGQYGKPFDSYQRDKQMGVLSVLEEKAGPSIDNFFEGDLSLVEKEKKISFKADDGLSLYSQKTKRRYGSPKKNVRYNSAKTNIYLIS